MKISKLLNLKPIPKNVGRMERKKAYMDRIVHLKKLLAKGGMSPKLTDKCQKYIYDSQWRLNRLDKFLNRFGPQQNDKKIETTQVRQGHLPNFLAQLDNVRIEELVAEKIFQRLATRIDVAVETLFKKTGSNE